MPLNLVNTIAELENHTETGVLFAKARPQRQPVGHRRAEDLPELTGSLQPALLHRLVVEPTPKGLCDRLDMLQPQPR